MKYKEPTPISVASQKVLPLKYKARKNFAFSDAFKILLKLTLKNLKSGQRLVTRQYEYKNINRFITGKNLISCSIRLYGNLNTRLSGMPINKNI